MTMIRVFYSQSEDLWSDVLLPAIEASYYGLRSSLGFYSQNTHEPDADTFDHRLQVRMFETDIPIGLRQYRSFTLIRTVLSHMYDAFNAAP